MTVHWVFFFYMTIVENAQPTPDARRISPDYSGIFSQQQYLDFRLAHLQYATVEAFSAAFTEYAVAVEQTHGPTWHTGLIREIISDAHNGGESMLVARPYVDDRGIGGVELGLDIPAEANHPYLRFLHDHSPKLGIRVTHEGQVLRSVGSGWQPMHKTLESSDNTNALAIVKAKWGTPDQIVLDTFLQRLGADHYLSVPTQINHLSQLRGLRQKHLQESVSTMIRPAAHATLEPLAGGGIMIVPHGDPSQDGVMYVNAAGEQCVKRNERLVPLSKVAQEVKIPVVVPVMTEAPVAESIVEVVETTPEAPQLDRLPVQSIADVQTIVTGELFKRGVSVLGLDQGRQALVKKTLKKGGIIRGYEIYNLQEVADGSHIKELVGMLMTDGTINDQHGHPVNLSERSVLERQALLQRVHGDFIQSQLDRFGYEDEQRAHVEALLDRALRVRNDGVVEMRRVGVKQDTWEQIKSQKQLWNMVKRMVKTGRPLYTRQREAIEQLNEFIDKDPYMIAAGAGFAVSTLHALAGGDPNLALGASYMTTFIGLATTTAAGLVEFVAVGHPKVASIAQTIRRGGAMTTMAALGAGIPAIVHAGLDHHTVQQVGQIVDHGQTTPSIHTPSTPEVVQGQPTGPVHIPQSGEVYVNPGHTMPPVDAHVTHLPQLQGAWVKEVDAMKPLLGNTEGWQYIDDKGMAQSEARLMTDWKLVLANHHVPGNIIKSVLEQIAGTHNLDEYMAIREHLIAQVSSFSPQP